MPNDGRGLAKQLKTMQARTLDSARRDRERWEAAREGWPAGCCKRSAEWLRMLYGIQVGFPPRLRLGEVSSLAALMGVNDTSARRRLEWLRRQGWVVREGSRPRRYRLAEDVKQRRMQRGSVAEAGA